MTLRFYVDECCRPEFVHALRARGWECGYVREDGVGVDDEVVIARARQSNAILITEDHGIGERVVRRGLELPGLIVLRLKGLPVDEQIGRLLRAVDDASDSLRGQVTIVGRDQVRVRRLS